jgi:hypothetical protein
VPSPIRNSVPIKWTPHGLSDAVDGTNSFPGAMKSLINLIPDPSTPGVFVARPAAIQTPGSGVVGGGIISCELIVGDWAYYLIPTSLNAGKDQPVAFNLANNTFAGVSGITAANVPTSPATSGDWTPPIMAQVAGRIIVTHPGFPGGTVKFGWFDISNTNIAVVGNTQNTSRYIKGNPNIVGIQPGLSVSGPNIPGTTSVTGTLPFPIAVDFTGDTHSTTSIDNLTNFADLFPGLFIRGPGIPVGATIIAVRSGPNSIDISVAATSSVAGAALTEYGANLLGPGIDLRGNTHTSTLIDACGPVGSSGTPFGASVGVTVVGPGVLPNTTITAIGPGAQFTLSQATTSTVTQGAFQLIASSIQLSNAATGAVAGGTFNITGGSLTVPLWGAGDTDRFSLPSVPVGVAQMNGRAWFALGTNGIVFSDSGFPCRVSNATIVQALTTNDGLAVTAIAPLQLSAPLTGGIVQALIAFEGATKMQQITGDPVTGNLLMNALPVATGTNAPLSVVSCALGTAFISPQGLYIVGFSGQVTGPIGSDGKGKTQPFQFALFPSRICAAANVNVIRITVQNGQVGGNPFEEYWFDMARQIWTGPHTFPARFIQPWRSSFIKVPLSIANVLFQSDAYASGTSTYIENSVQLVTVVQTVLLPDNDGMAMNAMVESNLACVALSTNNLVVVAYDENGNNLDNVFIAFGAGDTGLRQRENDWHVPIIFKQMSMAVSVNADASLRLGNFYMRYEILGYNTGDEANL